MKKNHPLVQFNNYELVYAQKSTNIKTKLSIFTKWFIRLLLPDFLIDEPSLFSNLKLLAKAPEFRSLRLAFISWFLFTIVTVSGLVFYLIKFADTNATVQSWDFSNPADYNYNSNHLTVDSGVAKLPQIDQIDDDNDSSGFGGGVLNDVSWDSGSNYLELNASGLSNQTGDFESRIIDVGNDVRWQELSWVPRSPYAKELPDNKNSESAYASGNADMSSNELLLHLNENSGTTSFVDSSGSSHNGSCSGTSCPTAGVSGKFKTAVYFDGNDNIKFGNVLSPGGNDLTICLWFMVPNSSGGDKILYNKENLFEARVANGYFNYAWMPHWAWDGGSSFPVSNNTWYHACVVYDHATQYVYRNGVLVYSRNQTGDIGLNSNQFCLGGRNGSTCTSSPLNGNIDEFSIFYRALNQSEIEAQYQRGVYRLKFQVRSCDDEACDTEQFVGPDGTQTSYYTELNNSSLGLPTNISLTNISDNRYFQYKVIFETDETTDGPRLQKVEIGPDHFDSASTYISNSNGVPFSEVNAFAETLGSSNEGNVKYQISNNSISWWYFDGANWVNANLDATQTSTASEVNSNIGEFVSQVGDGDFYFRAFLISQNSEENVELDKIDIDYTGQTSSNSSSNQDNSDSSDTSTSQTYTNTNFSDQSDEEYSVMWNIYDVDNNNPLKNLEVVDTSGWYEQNLSSPIEHKYENGTYTTTWKAEGYMSKTIANWKIDGSNIEKNVYLSPLLNSKNPNENLAVSTNLKSDTNWDSYFLAILVGVIFSIVFGFVLAILSLKAIFERNMKLLMRKIELGQKFGVNFQQ